MNVFLGEDVLAVETNDTQFHDVSETQGKRQHFPCSYGHLLNTVIVGYIPSINKKTRFFFCEKQINMSKQ